MPEKRGKDAGLPRDPEVKTVGNDETKRWRGGQGSPERIEERVNACYAYILEGGTRREIAERLASRFNTSVRTAHNDYAAALKLLREEQTATREELLNQMQAVRLSLVRRAIKKGQLMVASQTLRDMGAVIGETSDVTTAEQINLNITIEPQQGDQKESPR